MESNDTKLVGKHRHKKWCDSPIVNPITQWVGGNQLLIIGYKCTRCHEETYI